jgi:hypothetical protein
VTINEQSVYRHVGVNVNGVKPFGTQDELINSVSNMRGLQSEWCSFIDINTEWKSYEYRRNTEALLRKTFGAVRAKSSTSDEKVDDTHLNPGGTVKLLQLQKPHLRTRTYAQTYPSVQRATHLKSVMAHVYSVSIQNLNTTTVP